MREKARQGRVSKKKREKLIRSTKEMYDVFKDTEEEASHIKIFLEEEALKPGHSGKGEGASQPWLTSSLPVNLACGKYHCSPGRFCFLLSADGWLITFFLPPSFGPPAGFLRS